MYGLFEEFPNIHPMIVHFPIVLLLLALIIQISTFFIKSYLKQLNIMALLFLIFGTLASLVAIQIAPHISGEADSEVFEIFEKHHQYALLTFWTALGISVLYFILLKWYYKKWTNIVIAVLLTVLSSLVFITGHNGAKMVYIYNIGPQGKGILTE